jgi:hypothetical protein
MREVFEDDEIDAGFEEYRDSMYLNFDVISQNTFEFMRDDYFSPKYKLSRVQEMLDFFLLEDRYDKCEKLMYIKAALEVDYIISEVYNREKNY